MSAILLFKMMVASATTAGAVFMLSTVLLPLWDHVLQIQAGASMQEFQRLRMNRRALFIGLRVWSMFVVAGIVGLAAARCIPFAILAGIMGWQLPAQVLRRINSQRVLLLEEQLASAATAVSNGLKAGMSIHESLRDASQCTPDPLKKELEDIVVRCDHGLPLSDCMKETRGRLRFQSMSMFCLVLEIATGHSGQINKVMNRLTESLQEWFRLRRKIAAQTSSARLSILIMSACPFVFPLGFYFLGMSDVLFFFTTLVGQVVFSLVIGLTWVGIVWASRIVDIEVA